MTPGPEKKPEVIIAGASGFIGTSIRETLGDQYRWKALTRSNRNSAGEDENTEWVSCDLFSLPRLKQSMRGARYGIYLVHSMMPSSRLTQAHFADLDLLLADNFARSAEANQLEHIIYLGGLMPEDDGEVSRHLTSRREVEAALRSRGVPVTALRAGLIFGPGGSSARMLINLIRRLPYMVLPDWTQSITQTIDVTDIVRAIDLVLSDPSYRGGTFDLACHEPMTYAELIERTGEILGKSTRSVKFPANAFALSRLWVSIFGDVPMELVEPLLDSLEHDLRARPNPLLERIRPSSMDLQTSVLNCVDEQGRPLGNPPGKRRSGNAKRFRVEKKVRSVQRMSLPPGWRASHVATDYGDWLTRSFLTIIRVKRSADGRLRFIFSPMRLTLLELTPTPFTVGSERRRAFYISGGVLVRSDVEPKGRFEFRIFPEIGCVIAAIHDYPPRLSWFLYSLTQAKVHLLVMRAYGKRLKTLSG